MLSSTTCCRRELYSPLGPNSSPWSFRHCHTLPARHLHNFHHYCWYRNNFHLLLACLFLFVLYYPWVLFLYAFLFRHFYQTLYYTECFICTLYIVRCTIYCHLSFSSQSSKYPKSQTVKTRNLKFWDSAHHPLCVMCNVICFFFFLSKCSS